MAVLFGHRLLSPKLQNQLPSIAKAHVFGNMLAHHTRPEIWALCVVQEGTSCRVKSELVSLSPVAAGRALADLSGI